MKYDQLLYLAGPYSFSPEIAFERHAAYAASLLQKGFFIFSPILHNHQLAHTYELPKDAEFWQGYNKAMLLRCTELWVMLEPGWDNSKGTQYEIAVAIETNKPIKYITLYGNGLLRVTSTAPV